MIESVKSWFGELSLREKILITTALVLLVAVLAWYAVIMPLDRAIDTARERHQAAVERKGAIAAKIEQLKSGGGEKKAAIGVPLNLFIGQSAGEIGFTLDKNDAHGSNKTDIVIASARATAFFSWLAALERRGIGVDSLAAKPARNGTISVTATLVKNR